MRWLTSGARPRQSNNGESLASSRRNLQLPVVKQQKVGEASFFHAAVIADDDDLLPPVDNGRADPFGAFEALKGGNSNTAWRLTWMTAPEPELELNLLASDRTTDNKVPVERGKVGYCANPVAAEVQCCQGGRDPG